MRDFKPMFYLQFTQSSSCRILEPIALLPSGQTLATSKVFSNLNKQKPSGRPAEKYDLL